MEEPTTTPPAVDEGAQAQPDEQVTEVAEDQPDAAKSELPKPSQDDNLEWLKNKGIDPTSPEAITAVADKWRTAEREMHKKTEESKLNKTITAENQQVIADASAQGANSADIALARIAAMEVQSSVDRFFSSNPDAKQQEEAMVKIISERPAVGQMVRSGALGIDDLYAMTVGKNIDSVKAQGGQQALQQLANKQTAAAVPGAATTSAVAPKKGDPILDLWAD